MIDKVIVFTYLFFVLFIGIFNRSKSQTFSGYAAPKNIKFGKITLMATIFATSVGGGTVFGLSEKVFSENFTFIYALSLAAIIDIIVAKFISFKLTKYNQNNITSGDVIEKFYGVRGKIIFGIASSIVSFGYVAVQISVGGTVLQYLLETSYFQSVLLSYLGLLIYTSIGGIQSVIITNIIQSGAIILTVPIIGIIGLKEIGTDFFAYIPKEKYEITFSSMINIITIGISFGVSGLYPAFIQRILISRNQSNTRKSIYIKSVIYIIFLFFIGLNGLVAYYNFPNLEPSVVMCKTIDLILPSGIRGLVIVGLISATMSTADSELNVTSISIVNDLIKPIFNIKNERTLKIVAQFATIGLGTISIVLALNYRDVIELCLFAAAFWAPVSFVPIAFCVYDKKITENQFVFSSIFSIFIVIIWEFYYSKFYYEMMIKSVLIGTLVNFILFISFYMYNKFTAIKNINNEHRNIIR